MFSIPTVFSNEAEGYITIPAIKKFASEDKKFKTTENRQELINNLEKFANSSPDNEELVLDWLDKVLIEGIKDIQIKCINPETIPEWLNSDELTKRKLDTFIVSNQRQHLCSLYSEEIKLFKYQICNSEKIGHSIKFYLGKQLCTFDKNKQISSKTLYPIFVEVYVDTGIIVTRAKSKSGLYNYMEKFILENATTTTVEKQISIATQTVCKWIGIKTLSSTSSSPFFKKALYEMLKKYTKTPLEINELMEQKSEEINGIVDSITNDICNLKPRYRDDVHSSIMNMIEKYFSITYPNKKIFTQDRDAFPMKLNATDEEESKVEQTSAQEDPLQSKAVFFDNKKMLQKNHECDVVQFKFQRINSSYFEKWFKVRISVKNDICTLKFTEYTAEEDILNVLFSLINPKQSSR